MDNQYFILTIIIWTIIIIYFHQSTIKNMQLISQYKYQNSLLQNEQKVLEKEKKIKGPSRKWTSNLINIPTRGEPGDYHTVGYLTDDSGEVLPLTGRQTYPGSINWNYFTTTNSHLQVQIPVYDNMNTNPNNDCQDNKGCKEFRSGDTAWVNNKKYTVTMHRYNQLRYIPIID